MVIHINNTDNINIYLHDCTLSIDNIGRPRELFNLNALRLSIMKLLLMDKGTYESIPEMGVGIRDYRYDDEENIENLRYEIEKQISTYLPYFSTVEVRIKHISNKTVKFIIVLDNELIAFKSDENYNLEELSIF